MPLFERLKHHFTESIQTKISAADTLLPIIATASQKIVQSLLDGHKMMIAGDEISEYNALYFTAHVLNHHKQERPALPAIFLSDPSHAVFTKQLRALGQMGDILFILSANPDSENTVHMIKVAQDRKINIIALTGHTGGKIAPILSEDDIEIRVPALDTLRIQEMHLLIIHCLCDIVDYQLFGHGEMVT